MINKRVVAFLVLQPALPSLALPLSVSGALLRSRHLSYQLELALSVSILHSRVYGFDIFIRYRDECEVFLAVIIQDLIQHLRGGILTSSLFYFWQALNLEASLNRY